MPKIRQERERDIKRRDQCRFVSSHFILQTIHIQKKNEEKEKIYMSIYLSECDVVQESEEAGERERKYIADITGIEMDEAVRTANCTTCGVPLSSSFVSSRINQARDR